MYGWTNEEAILYNGIVQVVSCGMSTITYALIGSTRIGKWFVAALAGSGAALGSPLKQFSVIVGSCSPLAWWDSSFSTYAIIRCHSTMDL